MEKEHAQYLKDSHRIEDRSGAANGFATSSTASAGVDFESLVSRGTGIGGANGGQTTTLESKSTKNSWDDDIWGSILADTPAQVRCFT